MVPYLTIASQLGEVLKHRGVRGLIDSLKETRTGLLHYLSGEYPNKKVPGLKVIRGGLPIMLKPLETVIESFRESPTVDSASTVRLLLTLLYCTRALSIGRDPSTTSITDTGPPVPSTDASKITSF
jgi:hypothetical protein